MSLGSDLRVRSQILRTFGRIFIHTFIMAKGNLFLGMGRGSIGDVTFYRADGQQLARVRNRRPKNPKTEAQLYQRAIMATVVKAYQAGKAIFDHSFEGFSVGAQNQRQFMSLNAKMLRQLVATDINTPIATNSQKARVVAPGTSVPVAIPFIISRGSYQQNLFTYDSSLVSYKLPDPTAGETVAQYAARLGLIAGDIYTFLFFAEKKDIAYESSVHDDVLASLNYCSFGFVRLIVKDGLSNVNNAVSNYGQIFNVQSSGGDWEMSKDYLSDFDIDSAVSVTGMITKNNTDYTDTGAIGLIRSRVDQDLRSDSVMYVKYGSTAEDMFGIASDYILDEWLNSTTTVGNSELILEGGSV